jgi:hypothetical protein
MYIRLVLGGFGALTGHYPVFNSRMFAWVMHKFCGAHKEKAAEFSAAQ